MALVDQIHALATKCAQMDKDLDTRLSSIASITEVEQSLSNSKNTVPSSYAVKEAIDEVAKQGGNGRNIGEVFYSLVPLVDATVHLLNGGLIYQEGIYQNFVNYMVGLYEDGNHSSLFVTEAEFQQSITTYGVCGKFVWDSVNKTLRLPRVTGFIEGTIVESAIGDLVEAGLPNITGSAYYVIAPYNDSVKVTSGAINMIKNDGYAGFGGGSSNTDATLSIDASASNPIYSNSDTVQPQAIKGYVYIVLANAVKTQIEVDIDNVATELNGKADVDLMNCTKPYIIESYQTSGTNTTYGYRYNIGYEKLSNGKVVQYGQIISTTSSTSTVDVIFTLLVPMKDDEYMGILNVSSKKGKFANNAVASYFTMNNKTASSFQFVLQQESTSYTGLQGVSFIIIGEYATE